MFKRLVLIHILFSLSLVFFGCAGFNDGEVANKGQAQKAYTEIKPLPEPEDPETQRNLGLMSYYGKGVPQNYAEALKWWRKAAEQGDTKAQYNLGLMYEEGKGVVRDYAEAVKWYRKAAEQGNLGAQHNLGLMSYYGKGVPQDYAEALRWWHKEAEQGDAKAQYNLGLMYQEGKGVAQDYAEAGKWYYKSAQQGNAEAQTALKALSTTEISLEAQQGIYALPVRINGVLTLKFILDTGASEVSIPADVALTLLRTGTITQSDFLPGKLYELADGSILKSSRLTIRELEIGGIKIGQVPASVVPANGSLLLGQSFLGRLESWSLDNKRHVLIIGGGNRSVR